MCIIYYYIIYNSRSQVSQVQQQKLQKYINISVRPQNKKRAKNRFVVIRLYIQSTYNIYHHLTIDIFYIYNNTIRTQTYIKRKERNEWILQRMNQIEDMNKCQIL